MLYFVMEEGKCVGRSEAELVRGIYVLKTITAETTNLCIYIYIYTSVHTRTRESLCRVYGPFFSRFYMYYQYILYVRRHFIGIMTYRYQVQ